jgi:hypothetical protein
MALDPNISLGVRGIEIANPLAQYSQLAQIQNAQNQNSLAQYQLGAAQRQDATQNALSDAYRAAYNPDTGGIDNSLLMRNLADRGAGHLIPDIQTKMLATQEKQGSIKKTAVETTGLEFDQRVKKANKAIADIATLNNSQEAIASIDAHLANGDIDQEKANMLKGQLTSAPSFGAWQTKMLTNILDAKGKLEQQRITTKDTDRGGYIERQTYDAQGLPVGLPIQLPKTQTFADITAAKNATTSAGQLAVAQAKFAYEKANPSKTIQDTPSGLLSIDKNGVATPVVYGPNGIVAAAGPNGSAASLPTGTPGTAVMGRQSELKAIPSNVNLAILKNNQSIQQIDDTIKLLQQNPDATGFKGYLPNFALNRMNPEGTEARAGVADIGSLVLHDRSGAAVTASESPRLLPFIPLATDDNATVIKKLTRMRNLAAQDQTGLTETYSKDQGYQPNPVTNKNSGTGANAQTLPPIYATNGNQRIVSVDGGKTWTPAK